MFILVCTIKENALIYNLKNVMSELTIQSVHVHLLNQYNQNYSIQIQMANHLFFFLEVNVG